MAKKRIWLTAAALAASSVQAYAAVPQTTLPTQRPSHPVSAGATGLTALDLIVGLDGRIAVDVRADMVKVADQNTNNGC
jgi:hypothetical protein